MTAGVGGGAGSWPADVDLVHDAQLDGPAALRRSLEAVLFVADEPLTAGALAALTRARVEEVEATLADLAGAARRDGRGIVVRQVAGGWRLFTHPATRETVEAYVRSGQSGRLTQAALETLAVIAYRQPVARHQVAAVRGVNVDGVVRTLLQRGLVHEVGRSAGPGQAALYGTTPGFLEQLGLDDLSQLPQLAQYLPEGIDLDDLEDL